MNARGITGDWLNCYQLRRERITILQCRGFALLRSAPLCLRGSQCTRRALLNITDNDFEIDKELARF